MPMTLNEFIDRAVSYFDKAESAEQKESAKLSARIAELEDSLAKSNATIAERDQSIKDLQAQIEPQAVKIKSLETELAAEKAKVTETLAGLGVDPKAIPAAGKKADAAPKAENILEKYQAITDPTERISFYRANRAAIDLAFK